LIALCGGIVLEEALGLSFDRLLMMMMMTIYIILFHNLIGMEHKPKLILL